ncbi:FAD-dependent oxidoreductase [Rhizobium helianthi]|uniref:FAD-dependent oxidoreductase n=1 Tax=Rhizobium helianthi TaxID=1132695 RepID=A0ABW4M800_9HYPH
MIANEWEGELPVADVCIVGAGPVGLSLAIRCQARGLSVLVLEAGGADPAQVRRGETRFTSPHHAPLEAVIASGLGGTSALWGGRCVPFDDIDFAQRDHVNFSNWPITHAELSAYYEEALRFLHCDPAVAGSPMLADDIAGDTSQEFWSAQPHVGLARRHQLERLDGLLILLGAQVIGLEADPQERRVTGVRLSFAGRERLVRGRCFVFAAGGLENARLLFALAQQQPRVCEAFLPALGRYYQGHLTGYLALIEFRSARLADFFAFQRTASSGIWRRRLQIAPDMQNELRLLNAAFWLDAISIADPAHGSGILSLAYLIARSTGFYRRVSTGFAASTASARKRNLKGHLVNLLRPGLPFQGIGRLGNYCLSVLQSRKGEGPDRQTLPNPRHRFLLRYHAEQVPNPHSRVTADAKAKLGHLPSLSVNYQVTDQDLDSVLRSHDLLDRWLRGRGLGRLIYLHPAAARRGAVLAQAFDGYHQIGLTRMAHAADEGVADANCRVFGLFNLYLAGSGLFATSGQANPTLPAVALALRLADHLASEA